MDIEKIIRSNINRTYHFSLGTCLNNRPWVCEVHFAYDEDLNIYFRSLVSRRHSLEISKNPNVSGSIIDKYDLGEDCIGIYFEGKASLVTDNHTKQIAAKSIIERLNAKDSIIKESEDLNNHQFYKIVVSKWYIFGKFGKDVSEKMELSWKIK